MSGDEMIRGAAIDAAAEALGVTKDFRARLIVTTRYELFDGDMAGVDAAHVARKVRDHLDNHAFDADFSNESGGVEGDEILTVYPITEDGDYDEDEEEEFDLRAPGEPFSWSACEFVKELAKVPTCSATIMAEWVHKARELLKEQPSVAATNDGEKDNG